MAYAVVQEGGALGSTGGSLSQTTGAGNTLIVYITSNSATVPTVTMTGPGTTMTCAYYSAGHNGDYSGIFYCLNTPNTITAVSYSGAYGGSYREVSGIVANPIMYWNFGGNASTGTTFSCALPGLSASGDFTTLLLSYDVTNSGTPKTDGWTDDKTCSNFAQTSYTTATTAASGSLPSTGTYDWCIVNIKQANQVSSTAFSWAAVGSLFSQNLTTSQGSFNITPVNVGDLLVVFTKVGIGTNYVTGVSSAGTTGWTQILANWTDTNGTPHTQNAWMGKVTAAGATTLTLTFNSSIGSTAVELLCQEFSYGVGSGAVFTADVTSHANNGAANYHTWPTLTPTYSNGELFVGYARVVAGGTMRTPSAPSVVQFDSNSNPFLYALNIVSAFGPQVWDTTAVVSYPSDILIYATVAQSVTTTVLAGTASFPAPTVDSVKPAVLAATVSFPAPAVDSVQPAVLAATVAFPARTVNAGSGKTTTVLSGTVSFPAAAITAQSNATVTPAALAPAATFGPFTVNAGSGLTTTVLAATASFTAPAITATSNATVTPAVLAASVSFAATPNAGSGVTPAVLAGSVSFAVPAIDIITPAALAASASFPAPAVDPVQPAVLAATTGFSAPTVNAGSGTTPAVLAATVSFPAVTVNAGSGVTPAVLSGSVSFPAATVNAGSGLTATVLAASVSFPAATVSTSTSVNVTPGVLAGSVSFPAATPNAGSGVTPPVLAATASFAAPAFRTDEALTTAALAGSVSFSAVTVNAGSGSPRQSWRAQSAFPARRSGPMRSSWRRSCSIRCRSRHRPSAWARAPPRRC